MNVLMLNYEYPPLGGGGAAVCKDISERLVQKNYKVSIITMHMKGLPYYEIKNGVSIFRVRCIRKKAKVCHPWEQLSYCFSAYRFIKKNIELNDYDLVHCHFIIPTGLVAYWLKRKYGKKYILTAQGSDVIGHNNNRFKVLYKLIKPYWIKITNNAEYVTAPSDYLIKKIGKSNKNIFCNRILNGISLGRFKSESKEKYIVTLSRLQESKGIQDIISVLSDVNVNGWKVFILGDGPYKQVLEKMIFDRGLSHIVNLIGYVSDEEKIDYLSHAGAFFSGSWFEAMPISILEAMASGCRIIASNIEPHKQILDQECIYSSKEDLVNILDYLFTNPPESKEYDLKKYNWDYIVQEYEHLYEKI